MCDKSLSLTLLTQINQAVAVHGTRFDYIDPLQIQTKEDRSIWLRTSAEIFSLLLPDSYEQVVQHLMSLVTPLDPTFHIDLSVVQRFAKMIVASGCDYRKVFQKRAAVMKDPHNTVVWQFPVAGFPQPTTLLSAGSTQYVFFHGTSEEGCIGILRCGKVLRSTTDGVGMPPGKFCLGFFCKAIVGWPTQQQTAAAATDMFFHGKNQCNVVIQGVAKGSHYKPLTADTHREQIWLQRYPVIHSSSKDKRWCIREDVAHITHFNLIFNSDEDWGTWQGV